jgi:hypothetical protein
LPNRNALPLPFLGLVVGGPARLIVSGNMPDEGKIETRIPFATGLFSTAFVAADLGRLPGGKGEISSAIASPPPHPGHFLPSRLRDGTEGWAPGFNERNVNHE